MQMHHMNHIYKKIYSIYIYFFIGPFLRSGALRPFWPETLVGADVARQPLHMAAAIVC